MEDDDYDTPTPLDDYRRCRLHVHEDNYVTSDEEEEEEEEEEIAEPPVSDAVIPETEAAQTLEGSPAPAKTGQGSKPESSAEVADSGDDRALREFMGAYRKAREAYFQAVLGLDPEKNMRMEHMKLCSSLFSKARDLYDELPEEISSGMDAQKDASRVLLEISKYLKCVQVFLDEFAGDNKLQGDTRSA